MSWYQRTRTLNIISCVLCIIGAICQGGMVFLSLYPFWDCRDVDCVRVRNAGWLALFFGVLQPMFFALACFHLTVEKLKYRYNILAVFAIFSFLAMVFNLYDWVDIYTYTKAWSVDVIVSLCLMVTYVILVLGQFLILRTYNLDDVKKQKLNSLLEMSDSDERHTQLSRTC